MQKGAWGSRLRCRRECGVKGSLGKGGDCDQGQRHGLQSSGGSIGTGGFWPGEGGRRWCRV